MNPIVENLNRQYSNYRVYDNHSHFFESMYFAVLKEMKNSKMLVDYCRFVFQR